MELSPPRYLYWLVHQESKLIFPFHWFVRSNKCNLSEHQLHPPYDQYAEVETLYWERRSKPFEKFFKSLFDCKCCQLYQTTLTWMWSKLLYFKNNRGVELHVWTNWQTWGFLIVDIIDQRIWIPDWYLMRGSPGQLSKRRFFNVFKRIFSVPQRILHLL